MIDQNYLRLLISTGLVSRKVNVATNPSGDEGMGPTDNAGNFMPVMVDDGTGTGNKVQLSIACRISQQSTRARFRDKLAGKDVLVSTLICFTGYRTDVQERDRVIVDGQTYDLEDVEDPGLMHHHLEFTCKRLS